MILVGLILTDAVSFILLTNKNYKRIPDIDVTWMLIAAGLSFSANIALIFQQFQRSIVYKILFLFFDRFCETLAVFRTDSMIKKVHKSISCFLALKSRKFLGTADFICLRFEQFLHMFGNHGIAAVVLTVTALINIQVISF